MNPKTVHPPSTPPPGGRARLPVRPLDRVRSLLFALLFYSISAVMALGLLPFLVLPARWIKPVCYSWVSIFMVLSREVLGIRMRVKMDRAASDAIAAGPVVFAAQHQSMWETIVFNGLLNAPSFVLKRELIRLPVFGLFLRKFGMIAIDRAAGASALKGMVRQARAQIASGRSVVIYPQGTRVPPGEKKPYLPGVAALYTQLDVPVIPIALDSGRLWPRGAFVKRAGTVTVTLLSPIPEGLDRKSFMRTLENRIESACG
ncbi:1-acyl-sn-glycerol-3-phosphate acyltransferase [Marivibrio halodurans]|uniref:1-acyl-sn-glycerol-3-phosphate acyltransferase n=1 Tax=Marivibrio halodurans TaxID=2039722 RepID=A0A8J7SHK6_9PROT|nr:lysophospholipid acyltransferase family protein [Marivibrio halodurans]MBP5856478.1 1-acyl-sn-glycerol-3-phosphate acyltransferase [Marivibrio halodurans]